MLSALAKANKPLSLIHIEDTSSILAGLIQEDLPFYKIFSRGEIKQLVIYFNVKGLAELIDLECRAGKREFRHSKKGNMPGQMRGLSQQRELWAVRYTSAWRYKETKCIRRTYGLFKNVVDSISSYK